MLPPYHNGLSVESLLRGVFLLNDLLLYSTNLVPFETIALFKVVHRGMVGGYSLLVSYICENYYLPCSI